MPKMRRCSPEMPNIRRVYRALFWVSISLIGHGPAARARADDVRPNGVNIYQMITGDDSEDNRRHWDSIYNTGVYIYGKEPARFLAEHIKMLPVGKVLDIATGEGRNAVYLAKKGFSVDGVDYSEVALRKAKRLARENRVSINTINADLNKYPIKPESYDIILNIDYLQRSLVPRIKRGLKHGGLVVFENYTVEQLGNTKEQIPHDYLLQKGELRGLFKDFQILVYQETNDGRNARASLIARKP